MKNPLKAIKELREHDHGFLKGDYAVKLAKSFGYTPSLVTLEADEPGTFKGLTLYDDDGNALPAGTKREGIEAHGLAEQICQHLKVPYQQFFGIGSQLRGCCDALEKHFTAAA